jgi:DNA repair protein RecN (Recombination protein N)
MLKHLSIRNITIIDALDLEFDQGLTVITGESGSGKSILLDAIALAFGERVSPKDVLRAGQLRGQVELLFALGRRGQDETFRQLLLEQGILLTPDEDELLLSREFSTGGSRSRINGTPVNRETLELLRPWIIDLHGQHELTSLFRAERQLACLDGYGGASTAELRRSVYEAYSAWQKLRQKLDGLLQSQKERLQQRDFLAFQLEELENADLDAPHEDDEAREELKRNVANCCFAKAVVRQEKRAQRQPCWTSWPAWKNNWPKALATTAL